MRPRRSKIAIVGLGLMGGSLARALTREGHTVFGVDRANVLKAAKRARAIAAGGSKIEDTLFADVIVLAAPPRTNIQLLRRLAGRVSPETVITDLGSVKGPICQEAHERGLSSFVGGHPMAGSERSGFEASTPDLFRGHPWILTPGAGSARATRTVRDLARSVGAWTHTMPPEDHDRTVAFLSHVPQLVSWAIAGAVRGDRVASRHLQLGGPGFRDMTRLARSPRPLWREILTQNRREVTRALAALTRALRRRV